MFTQEQQEAEQQRRFALRQQKRKEKHRGGIDLRCFFAFTLCPQFPPQRL